MRWLVCSPLLLVIGCPFRHRTTKFAAHELIYTRLAILPIAVKFTTVIQLLNTKVITAFGTDLSGAVDDTNNLNIQVGWQV